ncbi:MAG: host attachment protein [Acidobacteria bacterium]|nr:host attachment protein [Acidobacteriota bacterium]
MDIQTLQKHVLTLATIEETDAPMVSCYLNLESGLAAARRILDERVRLLRKTLTAPQREPFEEALSRIETCLAAGFQGESLGAAVFSRGGEQSFFLDLQFRVPLPTWIAVSPTPNIYHLVELKDTYDRYVVVLVNERNTRVLEVHLGSATEAAWAKRPELRERVGRGSSREHYQSHRREQTNQLANEVVRFVDEVMLTGGYGHLILAGPPKLTAVLRQALPKRLAAMLVDVVPASAHEPTSEVVTATLASFIEEEQQESLAAVERLQQAICRHGLAVAGAAASLQALKGRQVDLLVMATEYTPEPAWICTGCGKAEVQPIRPPVCPACGCTKTHELDVKEELVRLAELAGCGVEIVHDSDSLMRLGGVGCLLRYLSPEVYSRAVA